MRYLSVCSGIEAATVAWHTLGWTPVAFAEIEAFPRAVLRHHYPDVPLHGDFTTIEGNEYGPIDILVGGTPCQDFSIAGLRAGLVGERGNLTLEFLRLAARTKPRWIVWENVPGLLSSDDGRALGAFLGGLAELGYGFAYRVLDAQYAGLAQRRERVFVVGYLGDWRRAAAVLFESESLRWDPPPRREAWQGVARPIARGSDRGSGYRNDADTADNLIAFSSKDSTVNASFDVAPTLQAAADRGFGAGLSVAFGGNNTGGPIDVATAVNAHGGPMGRLDFESETFVTHSLRAEGFDASEDGTGRGTPIVAFSMKDHGVDAGPISPTLRAGGFDKSHASGGVMPAVAAASTVRRLTPRECERLQGFPDDYTLIPYRGRPAADGPRYKALGNSMAVPVMRWIGERIAMVECLVEGKAA